MLHPDLKLCFEGRLKTLLEKPLMSDELPIIQKTYDLIQWYVPILNRLPRDHKMLLADRIITGL